MIWAEILKILKDLGHKTVPEDYYRYIDIWYQWYQGKVKKFHQYKVYNGINHVRCEKASAGMAKKAAEDWADLLMNEKVHITLEGEAEQQFFDDVCEKNNFWRMMNLYQEYCFALGTTAYVARVSGLSVNEDGYSTGDADELKIDFVRADGVLPLSWENGVVTECAFATTKTLGKSEYVYLQIHEIGPDGTYDIENHLYNADNKMLSEVDLESVEEFSDIPQVFHTGSDKPFYVIDMPNIANNVDPDVPLGISVYANGIDELKGCDNVFDSFNSEFVLGRKRIMVKPEATTGLNGEPLFDTNDLVFYILPEDSQTGQSVQEINSTLRTSEHLAGMQMALNMLSMKCGFGSNHWKFDAGNITTATQVISANSEEFRTLKKHEIILEEILTELVRIILRIGNSFMGQNLNEDVEISIDFDDSIIEDDGADFARDVQMVTMGILGRDEFRAKWLNEDIKTAQKALPQMQDLLAGEEGAGE